MSIPSISPAPPGIPPVLASASLQLTLRSLDAIWDCVGWESLPAEGNCYEVIDGVLYMCIATDTTI